jgi:hypothetical protein
MNKLRATGQADLDGFGFVFLLLFGFTESEPVINEESASNSEKAVPYDHGVVPKYAKSLLLVQGNNNISIIRLR